MIKAQRRQRDAWTDDDGDGGKCEVSGRRKEKLGFLFRKRERRKERKRRDTSGKENGFWNLPFKD